MTADAAIHAVRGRSRRRITVGSAAPVESDTGATDEAVRRSVTTVIGVASAATAVRVKIEGGTTSTIG